jgi:hypothetical protein
LAVVKERRLVYDQLVAEVRGERKCSESVLNVGNQP